MQPYHSLSNQSSDQLVADEFIFNITAYDLGTLVVEVRYSYMGSAAFAQLEDSPIRLEVCIPRPCAPWLLLQSLNCAIA